MIDLIMKTTKQPKTTCNKQVARNGKAVYMIAGLPSTAVEAIVVRIREETNIKVDWHYTGGRAVVLVLGTQEERNLVRESFDSIREGLTWQRL
jgi:uncharacterized membrane protein YczE